jgi:hypothetical protein
MENRYLPANILGFGSFIYGEAKADASGRRDARGGNSLDLTSNLGWKSPKGGQAPGKLLEHRTEKCEAVFGPSDAVKKT